MIYHSKNYKGIYFPLHCIHLAYFAGSLCVFALCYSSLSVPVHPSSLVLEKHSQTAVAKGVCMCGYTHLSPADGSFSGHTVPPARLPSRAWPSLQPTQQATGIASPRWQDPFYGLRVHDTSSNAGQYRALAGHLGPVCGANCLVMFGTETPLCDISAVTIQRYRDMLF